MDDSADKQVKRNDPTVAAERPEPASPGDIDDAEADDFAARNVLLSNAFGGGATPFAGALIGNKDKFLEPTTDEERAAEATLESKGTRVEPAPDARDARAERPARDLAERPAPGLAASDWPSGPAPRLRRTA